MIGAEPLEGMEFSTTPIDGSLKALVAHPSLLDTPTFEWLDARSRSQQILLQFHACHSE